ncbi:CHAP domain-containing protein [Pseudarthrobacter sp. MEB009]|uniref:CHAP domain-containing protein n=1 Tax=Pseudarthrobacter sp. MEB009 TaxID=3040326 RepID=UPI002554902C|nr:CHAP domain-containing protein [Pseudarthrobacter sp. MEB009]
MSKLESWLSTSVGKRLDPDGHYGLQCVDAVDHYGEFIFGVPWSQSVGGVRGAKDLLGVAPDKYWIRIDYFHGFVPQRGDVLVYGGDSSNEWGHTAVVESADGIGINVIQQDGFAAPHQFVDGNWYSSKPAHRARLAYAGRGYGALAGVLRPRPELIGSDINYQSATPTPQEDELSAAEVNEILVGVDSRLKNQLAKADERQRDHEEATRAYVRDRINDLGTTVLDGTQAQEDVTRQYLHDRIKQYSPAEIVALIPDGIAQKVLDELAERIGKTNG